MSETETPIAAAQPPKSRAVAFKAGNVDCYLTCSPDGADYVHIAVRGESFTVADLEELIKRYELFKAGKLFDYKTGETKVTTWKARQNEIDAKRKAKSDAMTNAFRQKSFDKQQEEAISGEQS